MTHRRFPPPQSWITRESFRRGQKHARDQKANHDVIDSVHSVVPTMPLAGDSPLTDCAGLLCFPYRKANMITAAEYRAWTEESLKWASEATTPEERVAHIKSAEIWHQCALRSERLSKQPPATKYEWVLPPFQQWRRR